MKHLQAIAVVGITKGKRPKPRPFFLFQGEFDADRILAAVQADPQLSKAKLSVGEEDGHKVLSFGKRTKLYFLSPTTLAFVPPGSRLDLMELRQQVKPDPTDLNAIRAHFGMEGTSLFGTLQVTEKMRKKAMSKGGPRAMFGSQLEKIGLRSTEDVVQLGATFLSPEPAQQAVGMLKGVLGMALGGIQAQIQAGSQPAAPGAPEKTLLDLLRPKEAVKRVLLRHLAAGLEGVQVTGEGSAAVLTLDRKKLPFLRLSKLVQIATMLAPAIGAKMGMGPKIPLPFGRDPNDKGPPRGHRFGSGGPRHGPGAFGRPTGMPPAGSSSSPRLKSYKVPGDGRSAMEDIPPIEPPGER